MADRRNHPERDALLTRVRGEFIEMPCLRLTRPQAQRLFGLRTDICERILATLIQHGLLVCDGNDRYQLNDSGLWPVNWAHTGTGHKRPAGDQVLFLGTL